MEASVGAEEELVRRAVAGDEVAFEDLIRPHLQPGLRLAVTMLGDPATAEDVLQEAVLRAWTHLRRRRAGSALRPWFLTVVANRCRSERRGRWWRVLRGLDRAGDPPSLPDPAGLDVERALLALSVEDRTAVFLRFYEDLPLAEVASVLGISVTAARSRVHRALRRMRLQLEPEADQP
jgi:RNA polymerase sigma-70 factor (ECF subfamily)